MTSLLPVLRQAHNDNPWDDATLHALRVDNTQIGFIPPSVMEVVQAYLADHPNTHLRIEDGALTFAPETTVAQRTDEMNQMAVWMRDTKKFPDPLDGYLDNSVAGGITAGDSPRASVVRECFEEAGLARDQVEPYLKQTGHITYFYKTSLGWRQPEMQYTYDLALPSDAIQLRPEDGEAESFELLDIPTVLQLMHKGEFKANCCLVLADFFIRHGYLTAESDTHYAEIVTMLHTDLRLPTP
ncbi:thiamine diphosphokinase [Malassezia brasiliensis]|uniref:Thiamine diphosphokinase n=1 Tax=Malassezia brasiliensis TaxID=1821822 RepID=A0AAF0IQ16_9BASI|nr:thiamine diphosphokinase [Malassezia brasiliensis]